MNKSKPTPWTDKPLFTIDDVVKLSCISEPKLHQLVLHKVWTPMFPASRGKPKNNDYHSYTARDILRVMLIAAAVANNTHVPFGDSAGRRGETIEVLLAALDKNIAGHRCKFVVPGIRATWCTIVFDIQQLVETELPRLKAYVSAPTKAVQDAPAAFGSI
jgi:hypothetical protein